MPKSDTIRSLMDRAGKMKVMTAEQEKDLARKLRTAKLEMWTALLADPPTVAAALEFCEAAAERQAKRKNEFDSSAFPDLATAARRLVRRPIKAHEAAFRRALAPVVISLNAFDPCMEIGLALFHQVKAWETDQNDRREIYAQYLQKIDVSWKRFVFFRNRFIERNIRLVMVLSKRFTTFGIPQEDLIQEGTFGLQKAAGMFDPDLGYKFSTYASWWIRAALLRYCRDRSRIVRLPVNTQEKLERYYAATKAFQAEGVAYDNADIANRTGIRIETIERLRSLTLERYYSTELESPTGQKLGDLLEDPYNLIHDVDVDVDRGIIEEVVISMPEREQYIIRERFGLDGREDKTLQEIAEVLGISRERVRQLEVKALKNLRKRLERRMDRVAMGLPDRSPEL